MALSLKGSSETTELIRMVMKAAPLPYTDFLPSIFELGQKTFFAQQ